MKEGFEQTPPEEAEPKLHSPFSEVTLKEFGAEFPEKKEALGVVLDEINIQGLENFAVFRSETLPGVSFSYTKLTVTPELVRKLSAMNESSEFGPPRDSHVEATPKEEAFDGEETQGKEERENAKRQDWFLFTPFAPPPDGHGFTGDDVAIDRYVRLLPRVAAAMKRGEKPPEVNVYMLGAPTGFGGSVTPEWIENIKRNGLQDYAKLYGEFIKQHEPVTEEEEDEENQKDVHIVLQGVSKGAIVAEMTSRNLPEELQEKTQRLLDIPAGDHKKHQWLKGAQVAAGLGAETLARVLFDQTMKDLMKRGGPFIDRLSAKTGIPKDTEEEMKSKRAATLAEGIALIKGSPLDTEHTRSFIRRGIYDPLTFGPKRFLETIARQAGKKEKTTPFSQKGRSLEAPFKGKHFFFYNRYKRWSTILDYSQHALRERDSGTSRQ